MQVKVKSGQELTEPVTIAEVKNYLGYPAGDQDAFIDTLITAARELLEDETGLSVISKVYEAEFSRRDADEGWYSLPFYPVTEIASVKMSGTETTYSQRGLKIVEVHPDLVISTGEAANTIIVEFKAGDADSRAKTAILRICSDLFNYRDSYTGASLGALSYDTQRLISALSINTGF